MNEKALNPDNIPDFLIDNLKDANNIFVFATDTAMNSWIEFLITNSEKTGIEAIPLERFIAWDNFKKKYLSEEQENHTTVPSILRKLFVQDFIVRNTELPQEERLQVVINPQDDKVKGAVSFADWICKNLPSLHYWKKRLENSKSDYGELDLEDKDYLKIYQEYRNFLEKNNLFEPSWIENLSFKGQNKKFIIFYPELLADFSDFKDVLSENENITLLTLPADLPKPLVKTFDDSRSELRYTMLRIIELVKQGKADWSEIALSVPDIDTYRPYLEREFQLYEIPFVIKSGLPLTKNSAGKIFKEIYNCHQENYSFDAIRALILDETVPWKKEHEEKRESLIRVGNEMRCICTPGDKDIWLSAFQSKINKLKDDKEKADYYSELKDFYNKIKFHVDEFFKEKTFENINKAWQSFKIFFLEDDSQFSENANNILGRCISELKEIIQIEQDYADCNLRITDPFDFFLKELDGKKYTPQQINKTGVNIFAYKLSGPAYFKYQFVIDASQKNLEIPYKRLTFLNSTKREKLHLIEDDKQLHASEAFIKLYAKNCRTDDADFVTFTSAESTFAGFAIPHSSLLDKKADYQIEDYILNEQKYFFSSDNPVPTELTPGQKKRFKLWSERMETRGVSDVNQKIKSNLETILISKRNAKDIDGKLINDSNIKITPRGDLEKFFPCPRKWLLASVLKLHDDSLDTNLMTSFDMGNLNHKILELFISQFQNSNLPFYDVENNCFRILKKTEGMINEGAVDYEINLIPLVEKAIFSLDFSDSPLVTSSLKDQKEKISADILEFLKYLLRPFGLQPGNIPIYDKISGIGNCVVVGCERTFCSPAVNFDYYGKIDCLLKTPENDWIIVDYKNGKTPSKKDYLADDNQQLKDFQMAVYCKLIKEEEKHEIAAGIFYSIKNSENQRPIDIFAKTSVKDENGKAIAKTYKQSCTYNDFKTTVNVMEDYAKLFTSMTNPNSEHLDFSPHSSSSEKDKLNVRFYEDCTECTFKSICRTTYNVGKCEINQKATNEGAE